MKRGLKITLSIIIWIGIAAYIAWAGRLAQRKHAAATVKEMRITVRDSNEVEIVRPTTVRRWIKEAGLDPSGLAVDSVKLTEINKVLEAHDFVRSVKTAAGLGGTVTVTIEQRKPVLRIIAPGGYDIYYTADGYIIPAGKNSPHYVPVVTGTFSLPFPPSYSGPLESEEDNEKKSNENYIFLYKLINFVKYIEDSDFWRAQIVQINVTSRPEAHTEWEVELIPRVGDHVVMLGWLEGYEKKLEKLRSFYRKALPREGWDKWNYVNLRYEGQVVCSRR